MIRSTFPAAPLVALFGLASFLVAAGAGCRSTSTNVTGPSSTKCAITLSGSGLSVPGGGGNGSISVGINRECSWSATSQSPWLTITSGASGQGPGTITFTAAANPSSVARTGAVLVNQQRVDVSQQGAACTFVVEPSSVSAPPGGGEARLTVQGPSGCAWTAQSGAPWVTVTQGTSGSGDGAVTVSISANSGSARTATLTVAGQAVNVSQASGGCVFAVSVSGTSFGAGGGGGQASITTAPGCEWTASSSASWLTLAGATSGAGNGSVTFAVGANAGAARTATLTVAGQAFAVSQGSGQAGCSFAVSPRSRSVAAEGGSGDFTVSTGDGCEWTTSSSVPWLVITRGASGTGSGVVSFSAATNSGAERSGGLTIAGETVTVTQAASACTYTVAPAGLTVGAGGGPTSVSVNAAAGCAWTATSNVPWVSVTAGATGTGAGTVSFSVAANTGPAREGSALVAGRNVTISQEGTACSYSLSPTGVSAPAAGGSASTTVTTAAGCSWTAASNDAWITIVRGATGTGTGAVEFSVAANTGAARTGTLTIAGLSFAVTQAASAPTCQFSLDPAAAQVPASGGTASFNVTAGAGCGWTSASNVPWITITAGASGTGSGTVSLSVAANAGATPRDGTVTAAGLTFTVTQGAVACTYTLAPTSASLPSGGGTGDVDVSTASACVWTASSGVPWLTITAGASGTGNGRVSFRAAENTDVQARTGTLAIAGQTFTVTQAGAGCAYTVAPLSISALASRNTYSVSITTSAACPWTASAVDEWIVGIAPTAGSGSATVNFDVLANTSGGPRTGRLTVAGQTVTINQP